MKKIEIGIVIGLIVGSILFLFWCIYFQNSKPAPESHTMREINYYLPMTRSEISDLKVFEHNPGDIIHTLCLEINRLRQHDIWEKIRQKSFSLGYSSIHDTPWGEFTIEEKIVIAIYGGSGSKLSKEEFNELKDKYATRK